jgi:hypothetical protein
MADPVATDIDVVQGATFTMQVTWADASQATPAPISLQGYRAHMQVRSKQGGVGTPLLDLSSLNPSPALTLEPGGLTGVIDVRISALDTAKLKKDCFNASDPTQAVRLVFGQITVWKSVTIDSA